MQASEEVAPCKKGRAFGYPEWILCAQDAEFSYPIEDAEKVRCAMSRWNKANPESKMYSQTSEDGLWLEVLPDPSPRLKASGLFEIDVSDAVDLDTAKECAICGLVFNGDSCPNQTFHDEDLGVRLHDR